ncbi:hypothetical protein AO263_30320 [Pseudomonas sp. NZIPFR-PS5]|nr:hypothetical protein AO263_30320 [Pseudomonas sp. NZIPFR-PS5]
MSEQNLLMHSFTKNSFSDMMLGVRLPDAQDKSESIFNRACSWAYSSANFDDPGYKYIQIFEPGVVKEIQALAKLTPEVSLTLHSQERNKSHLATLDWLAGNLKYASSVQRLNLATAYASFGQIHQAAEILRTMTLMRRVDGGDLEFEFLMLKFVIHNRLQDCASSSESMQQLFSMAKSGRMTASQIVEVCCQATVWFHKTAEVDRTIYEWFFVKSKTLLTAEGSAIPEGMKSSWYRAVAMIPSRGKNDQGTRTLMNHAKTFALQANATSNNPYSLNELKTYFESTIKEHLYGSKDYEKAEAAALSLLKLDPHWSPNWAEAAQVYMTTGQYNTAEKLIKKAIALG